MRKFRQQMIQIHDRASRRASYWQDPEVRTFVVRERGDNQCKHRLILPTPLVEYVSPSSQSSNIKSVSGQVESYTVRRISRKYDLNQILGPNIDYLIDANFDRISRKWVKGIECSLVSWKQTFTSWELKLTRNIAEQKTYRV